MKKCPWWKMHDWEEINSTDPTSAFKDKRVCLSCGRVDVKRFQAVRGEARDQAYWMERGAAEAQDARWRLDHNTAVARKAARQHKAALKLREQQSGSGDPKHG